jgi:hypothetical protein
MYISDFAKYNIENFTPKEVQETGADLFDVKVESIIAIQKFRTYVRRRVKLLRNGITTGGHQAQAHPEGYAIDFWLDPNDGPITIHQIYKGCLHAGFWAFGIYWNQKLYSFHGEVKNPYRKDFARWIGVKDAEKNVRDWQWFSLLRDPRKLVLE